MTKLVCDIKSNRRLTSHRFTQAPATHPNSYLIKGVVCGVRMEEINDPLMQRIRQLDKLVDELAKGKAIEKVLRQ